MNSDLDSKKSMRNKLHTKRKCFNKDMYQEANDVIYNNLIGLISEFPRLDEVEFSTIHIEGIGLYWPIQGEPDLLKLAFSSTNIISLPKILKSEMIFVEYNHLNPVEKSALSSVFEPKSTIEIIPKLIIIPGLCFSTNGYRIGFGHGYYDKYLNKIKEIYKPITIGVCFHENLFEHIEQESHDYQIDYIITDKIVLRSN